MTLLISHIVVEERWTTILYNVALIHIGMCLCTAVLRFTWVKVWTLSHVEHLDSFLFIAVFGTTVLLHHTICVKLQLLDRWPHIWYTEAFMVDSRTARYLDPNLVLWPKSSTLHLRTWQLVQSFCADTICLIFNKFGAVQPNISILFLSCLNRTGCFAQMHFCKLELCCHYFVFYREETFFPGNPSKREIVVQPFQCHEL